MIVVLCHPQVVEWVACDSKAVDVQTLTSYRKLDVAIAWDPLQLVTTYVPLKCARISDCLQYFSHIIEV